MTAANPSVDQIFSAALALPAGDERTVYLDSACETNVELRQRVERLLRAHSDAQSFLESPAIHPVPTIDQPMAERPGTQIGPYKLLQQIGEGGMGVVYMAEQTEPVQRKVALKVIKPGMDSRQIIARFEAERQALAMMDHVNIARVLDAGTVGVPASAGSSGSDPQDRLKAGLQQGRPYFVMELVHGVPITKYCDDNRLTPRQRLELFVPVCQAIQHAHQKGIIHRDIKPSNVMVTLYDGKPVPKVIDFGVAKATEQKLTERTLFTQYGTMVGTLEYMSPEQAEMSALGVDTRSDIYSLGVLLYELLTGSTPLSSKRMKEAAYAEILRLIKEEEPPKPSTRLSNSTETLASVAAQRHTEPAKLSKLMRGELDWIVMKTLEKDRNRRYETASAFEADVQRYLDDEPVQACPPSAMYRFRKFASRNRRMLATASVLGLALVLGTAVSVWQAIRATVAEGIADERLETANANYKTAEEQRERAEASEKDAKTQAALANAAQKEAHENLKDARAAVDQMLTRVADRLIAAPQMEHVRRQLLEDALKFYQKLLERKGDDPVLRQETAWAYWRLAKIQRSLGHLAEAEQSFRKAFAMFEELEAQAPFEPSTRSALACAHAQFARFLSELGNREEPGEHLRRAVQMTEDLVKEFPKDASYGDLLVAANVNLITLTRRPPDQEEEMLRRNLKLTKDTYLVAYIYWHLGILGVRQGRYPEAKQDYLKSLEQCETLASKNPSSSMALRDLGSVLVQLADAMAADGQREEAEPLYRRATASFDKLATDYPGIHDYRDQHAWAHYQYANLLKKLDRAADAESAYRRAAKLYEKLAADFPALPVYQQIAFDQRIELGRLESRGAYAALERAKMYDARQQWDDAAAAYTKAIEQREDHAPAWEGRGELFARLGLWELAAADLAKAAELQEPANSGHWVNLALLRVYDGDLPGYRAVYARMSERFQGSSQRHSTMDMVRVGALVPDPPGDPARLVELAQAAIAAEPESPWYHQALGAAHYRAGQYELAIKRLRETPADDPNWVERPLNYPILAMAHFRLGQQDAARQALDDAARAIDQWTQARYQSEEANWVITQGVSAHGEWWSLLALQPFYREARELMGLPPPPDDPRLHVLRARAFASLRRNFTADVEYAAALKLRPHDPQIRLEAHRNAAYSAVARKQWNLAAAEFTKASELTPDDAALWRFRAVALLAAEDLDAFRQTCLTMLQRFEKTTDFRVAGNVALVCVLREDALPDMARLLPLAQLAARWGHAGAYAHGNALYRAGRYEEAVKGFDAAAKNYRLGASEYSMLAMIHHRLGHADEARASLAKAARWIDEANRQTEYDVSGTRPAWGDWHESVWGPLLFREAEELLKKETGVKDQQPEKTEQRK